eukprot:4891837-Prymnesium_polylepis.1
MRAASRGLLDPVRALLWAGAKPDARAAGKGLHGATALYLAAQGRHAAVARALLDGGAAVDPKLDEIGITPLFVAASLGDGALVEELLPRGADLAVRNWNGVAPLAMAAMGGHVGVLKLLYGRGADVDAAAADGSSALMHVSAGEQELEPAAATR